MYINHNDNTSNGNLSSNNSNADDSNIGNINNSSSKDTTPNKKTPPLVATTNRDRSNDSNDSNISTCTTTTTTKKKENGALPDLVIPHDVDGVLSVTNCCQGIDFPQHVLPVRPPLESPPCALHRIQAAVYAAPNLPTVTSKPTGTFKATEFSWNFQCLRCCSVATAFKVTGV